MNPTPPAFDAVAQRTDLINWTIHQKPDTTPFAKSTMEPDDARMRATLPVQGAEDFDSLSQQQERKITSDWDPDPAFVRINDMAHAERLIYINLPPLMENATKQGGLIDEAAVMKYQSPDQGHVPEKYVPGLPDSMVKQLLFPSPAGGVVLPVQR